MKTTKAALQRSFCILALILSSVTTFAQDRCEYKPPLETRHWIFGRNLGLVFNDQYNVESYSGSQLTTPTGSAVMSDAEGNLLFYTNGEHVWDRRHQRMPNGQNLSNYLYIPTQAALIVPRPDAPGQYYLFLTDDPERPGGSRGFRYCLIDMALNGGYGDIVEGYKNVLLLDRTAEKLTAVKDDNDQDYWVITHGWNNDSFYAFSITNELPALSNATITNIGAIHTSNDNPVIWNSKGYMKVSPKGDKLASVIHEDGIVEIFDFNNQTGVVSYHRELPQTYHRAYGVEFSSDSRYLYFTTLVTTIDAQSSELFQVDVVTLDVNLISVPSTPISSTFAALQLGMDSKIYVIRFNRGGQAINTSLGVIENPKRMGTACNFVETIPGFSNEFFQNGLPNFIQSYFDIPHFTYYRHCEGDDVEFNLWNTSNTTTTRWDFGDGPVNESGTSTTRLYDTSGEYLNVSVIENGTFGPYAEDIFIRPLPELIPELPPNDSVLLIFPNTIYPLDGGEGFYEYYWYYSTSPDGPWQLLSGGIGETFRVQPIEDEGFYKLEAVDMECCENERIIEVRALDLKLPTAFRPSSPVLENQRYRPYGGPVFNYSIRIFNRWGQLVFEEEIAEAREQGYKGQGWDGNFKNNNGTSGVYVYVVVFDVEHENQLIQTTKHGWFMLLR
ncbi:MAG: gliding motility-associated C-terminal domain-containing protein [Bacteroidales bacterium]|nr:gliding motility-associated C-terminal domain-containing protein [Bacteroidales bacterium]